MRNLQLWVPELDVTKGGIQAYCHFFRTALLQNVRGIRLVTHSKLSGRADPAVHGCGHLPGWLRTPAFVGTLGLTALGPRPELVVVGHVNFLPVAHALHRLNGTRYVVLVYGVEAWDNRHLKAMQAAEAVLSISRFTRDRVGAAMGASAPRLALQPCSFEAAQFHPAPKSAALLARYGLPAHAPVIFTFGRLAASEHYKGFDRIIAALPQIQRTVPDVRYLIGGTGDDRPRLEALAQAAGVADRVHFTGFIPAAELAAHYNLCDVFAMPSTGEGFGIVFLEAMACGKPVLAGNRDGSVDPLADGRFGALVDPLDPAQLAGALTQILQRRYEHPLMWRPEELRRQVVAEFGYATFAATLKEHLRRLLPPELIAAD